MTNKEAIEMLRKGYPDIGTYPVNEYQDHHEDMALYNEAISLAIKALEEVSDISEVEAYCDTCKHNDGYPASDICQWCGAFHHYERAVQSETDN